MRDFVLHLPTRVIFAKGAISRIGEETARFGRRILFVHGRESIKRNGIFQIVVRSLDDAGISWIEHGGARPNPVVSHVREGIEKARSFHADAVIAVGGGSVIDSAKAICAGTPANHDVWQFFRGKKTVRDALPLVTSATLAGSGSELNGGMVLTNEETGQKFGYGSSRLYPRISILDPETTRSVPARNIAHGAADAISHVIECYCNRSEGDFPLQERIMEGLIRSLMDARDTILKNPRDVEPRAELLWCASLALCGFVQAGLGWIGFPMHVIEHGLSALFDVPHGAGMAVVMPAWMRYQATDGSPERIARLGRRLFQIRSPSDRDAAMETAERMWKWLAAIQEHPTLGGIGVPETAIGGIAKHAMELARLWRLRGYDAAAIEKILRLCMARG